jgi:rhodanese-related sulfurtransferase
MKSWLSRCAYTLLLAATIDVALGLDETAVRETIRRTFPDVPQIPPDSLLAWQERERHASPILLDVREEEEYNVSHLKGAQRSVSQQEALDSLKGVPNDTLIVLYCSVGYRSSALAETLQALGFTNIKNLEGSIFAWANSGFPVYRGDTRVNVVHPYDETWGALLERALWATTPDSSVAK